MAALGPGAQAPSAGHAGTVVDSANISSAIAAVRSLVPELTSSRHKGQAGRVAVVGGCREYTGAPFFSAFSAMRTGADLSHVLCSRDAAVVIKGYSPELIVHPLLKESHDTPSLAPGQRDAVVAAVVQEVSQWVQRMDCLVVGPGLGRDPLMLECIAGIMTSAREAGIPMVIDADGLFLVNQQLHLVQGYPLAVLTPNTVEMRRLHASLAQQEGGAAPQLPDLDSEPEEALRAMAQRLGGVTLVRKGQADAASDGKDTLAVAVWGSPRRCGGQGDILSGCIAVFLAWARQAAAEGSSAGSDSQAGVVPGWHWLSANPAVAAAAAGSLVVRHAAAEAFVQRRRSMVAGDILEHLGGSFERLFPAGLDNDPKL